jgi:AraC-like DNA-binding protein
VTFARASPGETSAHAAFFGVTPRFGAARNERVLDRALLAVAPPRVDGALSAFFERHPERMLGTLDQPREVSTASRVREALAAEVFEEPPSVEAVALRMGLGARTLRRRLTDEGVRFRVMRDEALRDRAMELLARRSLPLVDVAMVLGFSDQTAFQRAFKRWTGETPQTWRRARCGCA